jgi:transposase
VHDRHDLSDDQWALLDPLLPDRTPRRGGQWMDHRKVVDGVLRRTRTGSPWRDLPTSYGRWKTVYNRHRRWSADGTWARVLSELQRGCDVDESQWVVAVDSTVIRAHQDAAGARHRPPVDVPAQVLATALERAQVASVPAGPEVVAEPGGGTGGCVE